jgi:hypothetical protein
MNDFMNYFFGPLSKEYCLYYYFLAVISAVIFALTALSFIVLIVKSKKIKGGMWLGMFNTLLSIFIGYFVSRLLYTMCVKSL